MKHFRIHILVFFGLQLLACSLYAESNIVNKKTFVFEHNFKDVWDSAQIILGTYPLETNDVSDGLIQTTPLKPGQFWQAPFEKTIDYNYTQTLTFKFYKLDNYRTQLQIVKLATAQTDFLGSQRDVVSEPWEELRIVYKIKREVEIKKILARIK